MRRASALIAITGFLVAASFAAAQRPGPGGGRGTPPKSFAEDLVARMMRFDEDKDGKVTKEEVTDARLRRLFDRADANKDGTVTKEELTALAAKEPAGGPGGPGGPPGFGFPGGGPMMGPPRPGDILPPFLREQLELSADQVKQLDALQKEVDAKLEKILNESQRKQLQEMRERRPGRFGPPGGPPPFGDGPPPGDGPPHPPGEPQ